MNSVWTEEEKEYIRRYAGTMTDEAIATQLSKMTGREVSLQAARKQRQKMDIKKCHGRGICKLVDNDHGVTPKPQGVSFHIKGTPKDANA